MEILPTTLSRALDFTGHLIMRALDHNTQAKEYEPFKVEFSASQKLFWLYQECGSANMKTFTSVNMVSLIINCHYSGYSSKVHSFYLRNILGNCNQNLLQPHLCNYCNMQSFNPFCSKYLVIWLFCWFSSVFIWYPLD